MNRCRETDEHEKVNSFVFHDVAGQSHRQKGDCRLKPSGPARSAAARVEPDYLRAIELIRQRVQAQR
ncbi:MAG TPA: hypothetical protein VEI57_15090 [Nitrospirota bacterium]|nr:hypothetical protein [Nitrospirota bacterium]